MGRAHDLAVIWQLQHDAGAICEVDCCCECHEVEAPACKECCTYVEDEIVSRDLGGDDGS